MSAIPIPDGHTEELTARVEKKEFQRWAAAVGDLNPMYFDEDFARANGHRDVVMPPLFLSCVTHQAPRLDELRPDGTRRGRVGFGPLPDELDLPPRRMGGGEERWYYSCVHPGDVITSRRSIRDIEKKTGRSGAFVLVTWESVDRNQYDEIVGRCVSSMIAR
ncbi:FAS1-like dehydratase domain-containing protein [Streptomyces albipurpureus]|uniref:MaoC family dehydratase N-terminal domain-containing protein n=1 Tax=Streptomyces albipurpureus TaxID=2897419 RepID=A0ABT0UHS0_9ACTN|nr:MaoC family dehydratase N-terminal domain-containing protein [Streptomyces sp. CWNU-1]MCM2387579.1 MaoC family dehydratase N-terminal domain-containing protein [Streptomyces sp. CWNU-1]